MRTFAHAIRWIWVCAWRADPRKLVMAGVLLTLGYLATPVLAVGIARFTDAMVDGRGGLAAAIGATTAALLVLELMMGHFAHLSYFEVGEQAEVHVNTQLIAYANGSPGVEHFDSSEFADLVALVREEIQKMRAYLEALLQLAGLGLQLVVTTAILGSLQPWLFLLPLAALPPVAAGRAAQHRVERARSAAAADNRLARHVLHVTTSSQSSKEVRLFGAEDALIEAHDRSFDRATARLWRGQLGGAGLRGLGQVFFAFACFAAIYLVVRQAAHGQASLGDVVLVVTLAAQVNVQVATALGRLATLQAAEHTARRLERLRTWPARMRGVSRGSAAPPPRLEYGIRFEGVGFAYPGTTQPVLENVNLDLPAGQVVALVGENGAGKTTLVKLLCGLYLPTSGRITVDGVDLREFADEQWQARVSTLFQDFARFEFTVRENVGTGALSRMHEDAAVLAAVATAGAERVVQRVPGGLDGALGRHYTDGAELSGGQWQTLGLARTAMRTDPLIQVLDEPAAALDAAAEHALFERYADSADEVSDGGGITLFVSHRFSTVRMADQIVVLEHGRVAEVGSHSELIAREGLYADLFGLQARSYR